MLRMKTLRGDTLALREPTQPSVYGEPIANRGGGLGQLRSSSDRLGEPTALRRALAADGYLFLRGFADRMEVLEVRQALLGTLRETGYAGPPDGEGQARPGPKSGGAVLDGIARDCAPLQELLYGERRAALFESLFGEPVRHFDFTWLRAVPPGPGSRAHMDVVFMNRGSRRFLSAWTPLGDIPVEMGGVAVLQGSHTSSLLQQDYANRDVDTYCIDDAQAAEKKVSESMIWSGALEADLETLRDTSKSSWLTSDFELGDLLIFFPLTVHVGLDNRSEYLRLSCDSRYQPMQDPVDERWFGPDPSAHGARSKRGFIC